MNEGLKVFLAVADERSFTRAASKLHMTQPAVSQHIRSLELDLGAHLIERNNRMIRLTRAGEIVDRHARQIVQTEEQMRRLVHDLASTIFGALHIGASYSIGEYILPVMLADFSKRHPGVDPHIEIGNTHSIASMVASRTLDVGLVEGSYSPNEVETEVLGADELILVARNGHPLVRDSFVTIADAEKECWIVREEGSGTREFSDRFLEDHHIFPERTMTFSSTQAIKEAVRSGLGISVLSALTLQMELELGLLQQIQLEGLPITRQLFIVTQPSAFQPKVVSAFSDFAKEHFSDLTHTRSLDHRKFIDET